jgi:mannosyltransferase OCH1-like enzyme
MLKIPKIMGHIWVGHLQAAQTWMQTWRDFHPDWEYRLYDNEFLFSRRWKNQELINAFYVRKEYAGVSDLMRYEILEEIGGFIPEADSVCLRATDELWNTTEAAYTVHENENVKPGLVSPFLASVPNHPIFPYLQVRAKRRNDPATLKPAWRSVGNRFLKFAIEEASQEIKSKLVIFPSHYFISEHKDTGMYKGNGPVYCNQLWGTTLKRYKQDPSVNEAEIHESHMQRLTNQLA